jgi:hypothetical protein
MSREIHITRAQRMSTGPQVRGTHPITVSFENYRDKVRRNFILFEIGIYALIAIKC